jgi:small GTP-binding protein
MRPDGVPRDTRPALKVILVGGSGVGKTCLIASYLKHSFHKATAPTVAPAYSCRPVRRRDGVIVILQIWDTTGQERYSSISQLFFRDSDVALLCYDPTNTTSMESLRDWVQIVQEESPGCRMFGVLTKADKIENPLAALNGSKAALADLNCEQFFATSALTLAGVEEPFAAAAELFAKNDCNASPRSPEAREPGNCC